MAISTTTTSANAILNEVLADVALKALTPKTVCWNLFNQDSIDGAASLSKEYHKHSDLGPATTGTEGTDFSTTTTLAYGTTITATPTEAAIARADLTWRMMRRSSPGMSSDEIFTKVMSGDLSGILGLLEEHAERLAKMLYEKAEVDCNALLDDFSNSVGTTNVDLSHANILLALYTMETLETEHENYAWVFAPKAVADIRTALTSLSAASSSVWVSQVDAAMLNFYNDAPRNGLKGSLYGIPAYQTSPSVNPLPNAGVDVASALIAVGRGAPDAPGSLRGPCVFLEGHPMTFMLETDISGRSVEMLAVWEYAVVEHTDTHGITIISNAA